MYKLLVHQWLEKIRSTFWQKNIFINLLLGLLGFYLLLNFVVISFFADKILSEIYKNCDLVETFTRLLFYYYLYDLIARFLFQQIPTLSIQPYLTLPFKKSTLLHYQIVKSIFSFFNLVAILLLIPFYVKNIIPTQTVQFSLLWLVTVLSLIATNNFLNFTLKKYFSKQAAISILFIVGASLLLYLDFAEIISVSKYFAKGVYLLAASPIWALFPPLLATGSYILAYYFLKKHSYIEDAQKISTKKGNGLSFLENFGEIGQLIRIEIKLILRNKRPRSLLIFSGFFFIYGFIFFKKEQVDNYLMMSLVSLFLTASFSTNYGQFLLSWESSFFDCYLSNKVSIFNYLKSKYLLLAFANTLGFIIILPFAIISYKIVFYNIAFLSYNVGITALLMVFFSTNNTSYIDLGRSQVMNYQGTNITHFLLIIPIIGIPISIYYLHQYLGILSYYFYTITLIGLIGIALNNYFLELIVKRFNKRKYKMALGFRQK